MLIISPIKDEGVINLDLVYTIAVKELTACDGEKMFVLAFNYGTESVKLVGEWKTKEAAEDALTLLIRAHHCGNKEVYLE